MANLSARPYRATVFNSSNTPLELTFQYAELSQEAYQLESYPSRSLEILISEATEIQTGQSIDPELNPNFFSYGNTVTFEVQLTTGIWHQLFSGTIIRMRPSDGRKARGQRNTRGERTLLLEVGDPMKESVFPEFPTDVSEVTLGAGKLVTTFLDQLAAYKGLDPFTGPSPDFTYQVLSPIVYNPQDSSSMIDFGHKLCWCNPDVPLNIQYIWVDRLGANRRSALTLEPTTFLIDTTVQELPEILDSGTPVERPPGKLTITGQLDYVEQIATTTTPSPSITKGKITLPARPRVITEATEGTPAVTEPTVTWNDLPLSRTDTKYEIQTTGASFSPEEITTTKTSLPGGLIFTKHPDDIQEDEVLTIAPISPYRESTLLLLDEETIQRKIFAGPDDRLSSFTTTTTALRVRADENETSTLRMTKETETIEYEYSIDGIVIAIKTTTEQARGVADNEATEDLFDSVVTEVVDETWTPLAFSGDTDRYLYSRIISRPYFDNDTVQSTNPTESQPPEAEFFPGLFETRTQDISCTEEFVYGAGIPNYERTIDYGNALLSGANCQNSAEVEARLIYGQTFAKDIVFELTDSVIQGLWPSGADFTPYLRALDTVTNVSRTYLMDSIVIRAERDRLVGSCYGLRLGVNDLATNTIDPQINPVPKFRITQAGQYRTTGTGQFRRVA